ncbi:PE-PPE domain-containing protein [Mycobacterium sp. NPDC003323]
MITTPAAVISPAPAQAANSVFYVSGTRNNPAPQQMINLAEIGEAFTMFGEQALQIGYAAALFPFQGATALNESVAEGLANLIAALEAAPAGDGLVLIGVSQGDIVLTLLEQAMVAAGTARDVLFVRMAGPSGDTGVMGRNWGFKLPGLSFITRPEESPFDQVVLNHEYDGLGHWPIDQLNVLAVLNAVMGTLAFHNPNSYAVDLSTFPESDITTTVNSLGATTTTYLIPATGLLPILRPLQALGFNAGLLDDWHRTLKPIIDSAYEPDQAPLPVRVVQAMARTVVNQITAIAEEIGTVLRRIESAHRARTPAAIESASHADEQPTTQRLDPASLTQPRPATRATESSADPESGDAHAATQPNTAPAHESDNEPSPPVEPSPTPDTLTEEPSNTTPADEPDTLEDNDNAEPAKTDEPQDDNGAHNSTTSTTTPDADTATDADTDTDRDDPAESTRPGSDTTATATPPHTLRSDQDSGDTTPTTAPRSPKVATTATRPGSADRATAREASRPSSRQDAARPSRDAGGEQ